MNGKLLLVTLVPSLPGQKPNAQLGPFRALFSPFRWLTSLNLSPQSNSHSVRSPETHCIHSDVLCMLQLLQWLLQLQLHYSRSCFSCNSMELLLQLEWVLSAPAGLAHLAVQLAALNMWPGFPTPRLGLWKNITRRFKFLSSWCLAAIYLATRGWSGLRVEGAWHGACPSSNHCCCRCRCCCFVVADTDIIVWNKIVWLCLPDGDFLWIIFPPFSLLI